MISDALGAREGVAKSASLTVVRVDERTKQDRYVPWGAFTRFFRASISWLAAQCKPDSVRTNSEVLNSHGLDRRRFPAEGWIDVLKQVSDDIDNKIKEDIAATELKAVVSMSWGLDKDRDHPDYDDVIRDTMAYLLKSIDGFGVPMLASAGQPAFPDRVVDTWPQMLAEKVIPNLIVVGGVQDDGSHDDSTRDAPYVSVYAPSVSVDVADARNGDYDVADGTSPCML